MSFKKQFNKKNPFCKVTFKVLIDNIKPSTRINLAGDFNNWDIESIPMKKQRNGAFSVSIDLDTGREYQFKYLIDGNDWLNENNADNYVPDGFYGTNSVINL